MTLFILLNNWENLKIDKDIEFYFGLFFRITFYTAFLIQIITPISEEWMKRNLKSINLLIFGFAFCYLCSQIPYFFDGNNYGGGVSIKASTSPIVK